MELPIAAQLLAAGIMGGPIGFERRVHHKAIGIAGMVMIAIGSTTTCCWLPIWRKLIQVRLVAPCRVFSQALDSRGAVIFKSGFDVKGIKAAAAVG